jgi:hypothetical protein
MPQETNPCAFKPPCLPPPDCSTARESVFTVGSLLATISTAQQLKLRSMRIGGRLLLPDCCLETLARSHRKHFIRTLRDLGWPDVASKILAIGGDHSWYLINGGTCLQCLCFPIPEQLSSSPLILSLPECQGEVVSSWEYNLHTDPYLIHELGISFPRQPGIYAEFSRNGGICRVSSHAMHRFRSRAVKSSGLFGIYGWSLLTDRGALAALVTELRQAQPAIRKNSINQLMKHRYKEAQYLTANNWVYVAASGTIVTCYDKSNFITEMYEITGPHAGRGRNRRALSPYSPNRRPCGTQHRSS